MDEATRARVIKAPLIVEMMQLAAAAILEQHGALIVEAAHANKDKDGEKMARLIGSGMAGQASMIRARAKSKPVTAFNLAAAREVPINWDEAWLDKRLSDDELTKIVLAALGV